MANVLMLNTYAQTGGAAVATQRISEALQQHTDLTIRQLAYTENFEKSQNTFVWAKNAWRKRLAWLYFVAERLSIRTKVKDKETLFAFSPANVGILLHKNKWVKEADILHFHWINFGFLSLKTIEQLARLEKPIVWTLHDMWTFTGGCHYAADCQKYTTHCQKCPLLKNNLEKDLSWRIFEQKKAIFDKINHFYFTAPSYWIQTVAQESALLQGKKIIRITHPIDTDFFKPLEKEKLHEKYKLPKNKFFLLFGAMNIKHERKGFQYLKKALQYWTTQFPKWKEEAVLLVFGKAEPTQFDDLPLQVHYLGSIYDVQKLREVFNLAHLFLMPTLEEVLGYTVLEAMACQVPVVAFRTGGVPDMVEHLTNGYLAESRNAEDLAKGIQWVLQEADYEKLQKNARQTVITKHNYAKIAQEYSDFYTEILNNA